MRPGATPILHLKPPPEISAAQQRRTLDLVQQLNRDHLALRGNDDELAARIAAYELAFRMQAAAPDLVELASESEETRRLYGLDEKVTAEFGQRCLLARRMIERGVRFVQVYSGDTNGWDAHSDVLDNHGKLCRATDGPIAGLLTDLKRRGLWKDTLVIWGGEFGRTNYCQGKLVGPDFGRDHHPRCFTMWLAGGGVKGGVTHGESDEFGYRVAKDRVEIHDLHATILHLLGIDHTRLTFRFSGRDIRLTDVYGEVLRGVLA